jgi:hypothetical protein
MPLELVDPLDVQAEFKRREDKARNEALAKYGPDGQLPAGHPELDTLDYQIDHQMALLRYSEVNLARVKLLRGLHGMAVVRKACDQGVDALERSHRCARDVALALIKLRLELKARGLMLGKGR